MYWAGGVGIYVYTYNRNIKEEAMNQKESEEYVGMLGMFDTQQGGEKGGNVRSLGGEIINNCRMSDINDSNQTTVLCESSNST